MTTYTTVCLALNQHKQASQQRKWGMRDMSNVIFSMLLFLKLSQTYLLHVYLISSWTCGSRSAPDHIRATGCWRNLREYRLLHLQGRGQPQATDHLAQKQVCLHSFSVYRNSALKNETPSVVPNLLDWKKKPSHVHKSDCGCQVPKMHQ